MEIDTDAVAGVDRRFVMRWEHVLHVVHLERVTYTISPQSLNVIAGTRKRWSRYGGGMVRSK